MKKTRRIFLALTILGAMTIVSGCVVNPTKDLSFVGFQDEIKTERANTGYIEPEDFIDDGLKITRRETPTTVEGTPDRYLTTIEFNALVKTDDPGKRPVIDEAWVFNQVGAWGSNQTPDNSEDGGKENASSILEEDSSKKVTNGYYYNGRIGENESYTFKRTTNAYEATSISELTSGTFWLYWVSHPLDDPSKKVTKHREFNGEDFTILQEGAQIDGDEAIELTFDSLDSSSRDVTLAYEIKVPVTEEDHWPTTINSIALFDNGIAVDKDSYTINAVDETLTNGKIVINNVDYNSHEYTIKVSTSYDTSQFFTSPESIKITSDDIPTDSLVEFNIEADSINPKQEAKLNYTIEVNSYNESNTLAPTFSSLSLDYKGQTNSSSDDIIDLTIPPSTYDVDKQKFIWKDEIMFNYDSLGLIRGETYDVEFKYDQNDGYDAGVDKIFTTTTSFEVPLNDAQAITEDDIIRFESIDVTSNSIQLEYEIEIDNQPGFEETVIEKVELLDGDGNSLDENIGNNKTGSFLIEELPPNRQQLYKLRVITNVNSVETSNVLEVTTDKGESQPIEEEDLISFNINEDSITPSSVDYDFEISIPNNDDYELTTVEKIEIVNSEDPSEVLKEVDDFSINSSSNSIVKNGTIDGLNPSQIYKIKLKVYYNDSEFIIFDDEQIFTTAKLEPIQITSSDISLLSKSPNKYETSAEIYWEINTPSSPEYEDTVVEDVRLLDEEGNEVIENITYTDKNSETGTIFIKNLDYGQTYNYNLEVKTNAGSEYIKSDSMASIAIGQGEPLEILKPTLRIEADNSVPNGTTVNIYYNIRVLNDPNYEPTIIEQVSLFNDGVLFNNEGINYIHESEEWGSGVDIGAYIEYSGFFKIEGLTNGQEYNFSVNVKANSGIKETNLFKYTPEKLSPQDISTPISSIKREPGPDGSTIEVFYSIPEIIPDNQYNDTVISFVELVDTKDNKVYASNVGNNWSGKFDVNNLEDGKTYDFVVRVHSNANAPDYYIDSAKMEYSWDKEPARDITSVDLTVSDDPNVVNTTLHYDIDEILYDNGYIDTIVQKVTLLNNGSEFISEGSEAKIDGAWSGDFELTDLESNVEYNFAVKVDTNANSIVSDSVSVLVKDALVINGVENFSINTKNSNLKFAANVIGNPDLLKVRYDGGKNLKVNWNSISTRVTNENVEYNVELKSGHEYIIDKFEISLDNGTTWENVSFDMLTSVPSISGDGYDIAEDGTIFNSSDGKDTGYILFEDSDGNIKIKAPDNSIIDPTFKTKPSALWELIIGLILLLILLLLLILIVFLIRKGWKAKSFNNYEKNDLIFTFNKKLNSKKVIKATTNANLYLVSLDDERTKLNYSVINGKDDKLIWKVSGLPIKTSNYKFEIENEEGKKVKVKAKVEIDESVDESKNSKKETDTKSKTNNKKTKSKSEIFLM